MKRVIHIPIFFLLLLSWSPGAVSGAEHPYLAELISSASNLHLAQARYWQILIRYQRTAGATRSLVDDPVFFLSGSRTDPEAELVATLRSFFEQDGEPDTATRCRFPARYAWLKSELEIDESRLPPAQCPEYEEILAGINPRSATLVFPASFMNSPASMFGHTLLRVDGDHKSTLVSHAIGYAAQTGETSGLAFALKGIFGFYRGYYSVQPYYEKVKDYSELDKRDIWEYSLNLTEEETRRMFRYIWEFKDVYSNYYFFDENCSHALLFLLEAARPEVNLTEKFRVWVMPADTVRIIQQAGLISTVAYRPSKSTTLLALARPLSDREQRTALDIINGTVSPGDLAGHDLDYEKKIHILDLAAEGIQYSYTRQEIPEETYKNRVLATLQARSRLGRLEKAAVAEPVPPEQGHGSSRITAGSGWRENSFFGEIRYRPVYHELIDPDQGYLEGSQILFSDIALRYYEKPDTLRLHKLTFIDIVSIAPRNRFFRHISWKVGTGLQEKSFANDEYGLVYHLSPGGGLAYKPGENTLVYGFLETDFNYSGRFDDNFALGGGGSLGLIHTVASFWKAHLSFKAVSYQLGDTHERYQAGLEQNFQISRNNGIVLGLLWERAFDQEDREFFVRWNFYF